MNRETTIRVEEKTQSQNRERSRAPVFALGCVRSGTTLLYHMLLSAGGFAVYRTETQVLNILEPRFGDLGVRRNQGKLLAAWLHSKLFQVSGLDAERLKQRVFAECRNGGDFLRIVMEEIARTQGVQRWADSTPEHILYLPRIKRTIPDALVIQIIRDGRDVALSVEKQRWIRPLPLHRGNYRMAGALYWAWTVKKGTKEGRKLGSDYCEVRFEELIRDPRSVLSKLSHFLGQELDYDHIRAVGIGSVSEPNTSFQSDGEAQTFDPIQRWRKVLSEAELRELEGVIGRTLKQFGYPLAFPDEGASSWLRFRLLRAYYFTYFELKLWLKSKTPLGRFFVTKRLSWL